MEISNVERIVSVETMPVWAQVAFVVGVIFVIAMIFAVAWISGASDGDRAKYGHGKRGQGRD